jgi:hypothetical protein
MIEDKIKGKKKEDENGQIRKRIKQSFTEEGEEVIMEDEESIVRKLKNQSRNRRLLLNKRFLEEHKKKIKKAG